MDLHDVLAAMGTPTNSPPADSGVYVWVDEDGFVIYVGESSDVANRVGRERQWADNFRAERDAGDSLWDAAGCGLSAVLDHHAASMPRVVAWSVASADERKARQTALIRLSALLGATPPGQGAGWDYGRGNSEGDRMTSRILDAWFEEGSDVATHLSRRAKIAVGVDAGPDFSKS